VEQKQMSTQIHTPGPWEATPKCRSEKIKNRWKMLPSHSVWSEKDTIWIADRVDNPADARLIAAAPDMLAALKAAQFAFGFGSSATLQQQQDAAEAITAAIIKAEVAVK
jgi:hypothetical protein